MERGEGATTQQMEAAPKGAIFVWCNGRTDYPILLARKIGREDLQIKSPSWLTSHVWRGVSLAGIVVDHAARLTGREWEELHYALACVRPNVQIDGQAASGLSRSNAGLGYAKGENDRN